MQLTQPQVGIFQPGLGIDQLGLLVGEGDLGAADIQRADEPGRQPFALRLELLLQDADGLLSHADLGAIEQDIVKRDPHIHRYAIDDRLVFERPLFLDEPGNGLLAGDRAAGVKILHYSQRRVVVVRAQP